MRKPWSRARILLVTVPVLVAGCTSTASGDRPAAVHPPQPRPATSASRGEAGLRLTSIRLYRSGFGLVGGYAERDGHLRARLLKTTDFGGTFRDITPPRVRRTPGTVDDMVALGGSRLWFLTWNPDSTRNRLYRSTDGGLTWSSTGAPGHNMSAGSTDSITFVDGNRGWLVQQMPNGPVSTLYETADSGVHWHRATGRLPQVAPVAVDPATGLWQAGGDFGDRLARSTDGGRSWTTVSLTQAPGVTAGHRLSYGLPAFFGDHALEPVGVFDHHSEQLLIFDSRDAGQTWRPTGRLGPLRHVPVVYGFPRAARAVFASPWTWWVVAADPRPTVFETTDAGRHWHRHDVPGPATAAPWLQIASTDPRHAWVLETTAAHGSTLLATDDGGRTWSPLKPSG